MEITIITINQLVSMFFFMAIGFFFRRKGILDISSGGNISRLIVNVFMPCMTILSFANNFKVDVIKDKIMIFLLSVVVLTITGVLAIYLAKLFSKDKNTQGIYIYSFAIPNLGYMGYPLIQAVFGDAALLDTMVYCLPYNVYIYTLGMYYLTENKTISAKSILTPPFISVFVGMAIGLLNIKLPAVITGILETGQACMSPCAMILTGTVFARMDFGKVFTDWRSYVASAIRLLIIPFIALFILKLIKLPDEWILPCVAILAMPLGVNSVVFPEAYGGDAESGAKVCFMAAILALVTIPIVFALL